jgi:hypothetical protein
MDDSLAKYDENLETPEYRKCDLSDNDKQRFLGYYLINKSEDKQLHEAYKKFKLGFITFMRGKKGYLTQKQYQEKYPNARDKETKEGWASALIYENPEKWVEYFKQGYPEFWNSFEDTYTEFGDDWNGNNWRKDKDGVWAVYSSYNPDSKWDWYSVGGRWSNSIKTKSGEFVDMCKFDEIDFDPYSDDCYEDGKDWLGNPCKKLKEGYEWHYDNKDNFPFCVVIDGVWYEKGDMGWWGMVANEKGEEEWNGEVAALLEKIPADSDVYNVDFHI